MSSKPRRTSFNPKSTDSPIQTPPVWPNLLVLLAQCCHRMASGPDQYLLSSEAKKSVYVDNIFLSGVLVEKLFRKYHESKKIFAEVKMNAREFLTNNKEVMEKIPLEDKIINP